MSTIDKLNLKGSTGSGILDLRNVTQINEMKLGNPEEGEVNETFNPLMGTGEGKLKNQAVYMAQMAENGNFEDKSNITVSAFCTIGIVENECVVTVAKNMLGAYSWALHIAYTGMSKIYVGHKILLVFDIYSSKQKTVLNAQFSNVEASAFSELSIPANVWCSIGGISTPNKRASNFIISFNNNLDPNVEIGDFFKIRKLMFFDLTAMGLADVVDDLASFKRLFGYAEDEEMPFIPSVFKGVYFDSEGTVRNFPDDKFPFLRLKAVTPPSLTDLNANFHSLVIVPDDSFNQYADASNWNEFYKSGTVGEGVLYDDVKAAYEKTVAKYGSGVYDGTSKPFMDKRFNIMFPDKMKYWLGFGKSSFTLDSDGNPLLQIEPEDYLDNQSKKLEDLFPDTCPEEDRVYFEKQIENGDTTDKIKNDNELLALLYKNGMIGHEDYAYNWEIHNIKEIPDNFANGNKTITDISFLSDTKVETIGVKAFAQVPVANNDFHVPSTLKSIMNQGLYTASIRNVYYKSWSQFKSIKKEYLAVNLSANLYVDNSLITSVTYEQADGAYKYQGFRSINTVSFASDATIIGVYAFDYCDIRKLVIPDSVKQVNGYAFVHNYNLKKAIFGGNVTRLEFPLGPELNIEFVLLKCITPPALINALGIMIDNPIYVPVQSLALYKAADVWNAYTNFIPYNMDCDPLGLISDNGARECYCPMSNLDVIEAADYNSGTFKAVFGTAEGTEITMRHYLADETYTEETWTVKSDLTISE